jgi:hypothetical protein
MSSGSGLDSSEVSSGLGSSGLGSYSSCVDINKLVAIRREFLRILDGHIDNTGYGMCSEVRRQLTMQEDILFHEIREPLFRSWPEFSGNITYPVPAPEDFVIRRGLDSKVAAESYYSNCHEMYKGKYGTSRKNLAKYMVAELTKMLKKVKEVDSEDN